MSNFSVLSLALLGTLRHGTETGDVRASARSPELV